MSPSIHGLFMSFPHPDRMIQTAKHKVCLFDSWTNKRLNVLIRQPQTILYLKKKKRTYHNAINHVRASGFSWCHGQLQKALLIKFYSFCVDVCVKSLKIWSGTGAGSCCSKRHLNSFAWPLKSTRRPTWANFCISIRITACWGISSLGIITDVLSYSHFSFSAQFLQKFYSVTRKTNVVCEKLMIRGDPHS